MNRLYKSIFAMVTSLVILCGGGCNSHHVISCAIAETKKEEVEAMAQNETWLNHDLLEAVQVQYLDGNLFSQDNAGNLIGVLLNRGGVPYAGGGSVSANVIRADGATVAVVGALSGNAATVVLPQSAYAVPGVVSIVVKLTVSGEVTTIAAVVANVYQSSTDSIIDPGTIIPSIETLIAEIEAAVASIPADYSSLWTSLAPAFSTSTNYTAGQYVTYNGALYRFTTDHPAGAWNSAHVVATNIGSDLNSDINSLKSEFEDVKYVTNALLNDTIYGDGHGNVISNYPGYFLTDNGIIFEDSATFCYLTIQNKLACLGPIPTEEEYVIPNNVWPVLAENDNALIVWSMNSNIYYIKKDMSVLTIIQSHVYPLSYPIYFEITDDDSVVAINNHTFTLSQLNSYVSDAGISDSFTTLRLGISINSAAAGKTIPYFYTHNMNGSESSVWTGKTGDFLGDSLTEQNQYTSKLASLFGIVVNNYGKSGTTISNKNATNYFVTRVSSMSTDCDFVFVMGGTNDWGLSADLGQKGDITANTFYGGLYLMFEALRSRFPTKPIFVSTITQRNWQSGGQASGIDSNSNGDSIMDFNEAIVYMAHRYGCIVMDGFGESGICVSNLSTYTVDNLHFNADGGTRFAIFVKDHMNQITPY